MAGKFMKIKRLVIPMLVLIAILAQTTPAFALDASVMADIIASNPSITMEYADIDAITCASPSMTDNQDGTFTYDKTGVVVNSSNEKVAQVAPAAGMSAELTMLAANTSAKQGSFTDVPSSHWAKDAIDAMTAKGVIKGYGNGMYGPSDNVSRMQFAAMMLRSLGQDKIDELVAQASAKAQTEDNYTSIDELNETYKKADGTPEWFNKELCAIQMIPALDTKWQCSKIFWSAEASRADMALIIMSIAEQAGNEDFAVKDGIKNNIGDYTSLPSDSKESILLAYSNGILVGDQSGNYNPDRLANRAEAATIMQRVTDPSKREVVTVKPEVKPVTPPIQEGDNVSQFGTVFPKEGDMFNGKPITRDPETGILGFDIKGGIYLGIEEIYADGTKHPIQVGSYASNNYDNMGMSEQYTTRHGYTFWDGEFAILHSYARERLPAASKVYDGAKADIKGNIIKSGNNAAAFYECSYNPGTSTYLWSYIK